MLAVELSEGKTVLWQKPHKRFAILCKVIRVLERYVHIREVGNERSHFVPIDQLCPAHTPAHSTLGAAHVQTH